VALGKYREAVLSIETGLLLQPDWPAASFRPLAMYAVNMVEFPEHLRHLEETLAQHPDDPVLLFLYAYTLWFDGRRDEARPLFRKAAEAAPGDPGIQRFLEFRPEGAAV
jgi:tetratricopeptide (TPR) repeat protein